MGPAMASVEFKYLVRDQDLTCRAYSTAYANVGPSSITSYCWVSPEAVSHFSPRFPAP